MELPPLKRLGNAVRKRREALGMTQGDLGALVPLSKSSISRIELGEVAIEPKYVPLLDAALQADGMFAELWAFVMAGDYSAALVRSQEEKASRILEFDNRVFPGLLQTADYARAVIRAGRQFDSDQEIERDVRERISRQSIWHREIPPAGRFVVDESVLYRPYGGVKAMRTQLEHVLSIISRPRVYVQVVNFSALEHPGIDGPLRVLFYPDTPAVAYTEARYTGKSGTDADDAAINFDLIRDAAMTPADSAEFIGTVMEERYGAE